MELLTKEQDQANLAYKELQKYTSALNSITDFVRYMKPTGEKDFMYDPVVPHHLKVYDALQRFADGEIENLMILMPPGAGKSVLCTVQFPLWFWAKNPRFNILCGSNTQSLAEEFSRRRRSICESEEYVKLGVELRKKDLKLQDNTQGGTMSCYGVGSAVVGRRANLIMLDDPVLNSEQASSAEQLDKQMLWYDQDFRSRKVLGAKELIVTTRWSRRDIAGRLLTRIERGEETNWEVLRIPLHCDDEMTDPMGRKLGQQLWPEGLDKNYIKNAKRDMMVYQTMYQQLPYIQDGDWVGEDHIVIKKGIPDLSQMRLVIGADIALTQGAGDYTVFAVCGLHRSGYLHILHIERNRQTPSGSVQTIFDLAARYPQAHELLLDDDPASKVFKELLLSELKHAQRPLTIVPVMIPTKGLKKETRAANLRALFHQKRVVIWNKEFAPVLVKELIGFPDGCKHDDQVDALALVAKRSIKYGSFQGKIEKVKDPFEGMMLTDRRNDDGQRISNMSLNNLIKDKETTTLRVSRRRI